MLKLENVTYIYPDGSVGIEEVSMELPREHIVGLMGKSGSGKTTTLRCLGRFVKPKKGKITLDGKEIHKMPEKKFRKKLGIVFQQLHLFPHMNIIENIMLAPKLVLKKEEEEAREDAMEMLKQLDITELAERYPSEISGGQAQRVAIARGLALRPEYLLLDEPTSALDIQTSRDFGAWLQSLQSDTTFVIVTHDIIFVEEIASSGILLEEGKVKLKGKIEEIINRIGR